MRRIKLGNKMVKRVITLAMAVVVSLSTAMSGMTTLTVYAEETVAEAPEATTATTTDTTTINNADGSVTTVTTETTTESVTVTGENIDMTENGNVTVSEQINDGGTEYYVDGQQVTDEAAAQAAGQQDYIVKEQVIDQEATDINHYIVDAEGNYVLDENGNQIAVEDGTKIEQIEVIKKIENADAAPSATPQVISEEVNEDHIIFIKENEDGVKELVDADTEGAEEYVEVEDGEEYVDSVTVNELTTTDAEGNEVKQFVDDDLAKLLDDDDTTVSENYRVETVYTVTVKDKDGNDQQVEVKKSELQDGDKLEVNEEDGSIKVSVDENTTYSFTGKDGKTYEADSNQLTVKKEVTKEWVSGKHGLKKQEVEKYYITITDVDGTEVKVEVDERDVDSKHTGHFGKKSTTYSLTTDKTTTYETTLGGTTYAVDPENVKTEIHYEVYKTNENGEEELVMELTKEQYESRNLASKDYAKVDEQYVVYDAEGNETATFTEDEWKVITEGEVTYKEVTKMYYTTEANYIEKTFGEKGNELKLGDNYYKLEVKLFENTDGITYGDPVCLIDEETEEAVITVPYTLADGTVSTLTRRIALKDFGLSNSATVEIKYVPTYTTRTGYEFTVDVVKDMAETAVTVKTETVTTGQPVPSVTPDASAMGTKENPIKANDGEAVNSAGDSKTKTDHIDVRVDVNLSEELAVLGVKNAKVTSAVITVGNKTYTLGDNNIRSESRGVYEFNLQKHGSSFGANQLVTVLTKITYTLDGEERTLWYETKLYPNKADKVNNVCKMGGFDYEISLEEINNAIEQQITATTSSTNISVTDSVKIEIGVETSLSDSEIKEIISVSVDEGSQKVTGNLINALVFVRLDGIEQEENGKTHYPSSEYSKDLAKGQVILLYAPDGYKVYGEIGDETVYGRILTWIEDGTESKMDDIEKAYLENLTDKQKEQLKNRVELEAKQQIEAQKKTIARELLGDDYAEEQFASIVWTIDEEQFAKSVEDVLSNLDVRWYVLKDESDGTHIDGVIITKKAAVNVEGKLPVVPTPTVEPTATPTVEPTAAPTTAPVPPVVIIEEEPVPMADVPVVVNDPVVEDIPMVAEEPVQEAPVMEEAAVLGATRTEEGAVLGATRGREQAVLGKRRRPETGDGAALTIWMSIMAMSTGMAGLSGTKLIKGKKKNEDK